MTYMLYMLYMYVVQLTFHKNKKNICSTCKKKGINRFKIWINIVLFGAISKASIFLWHIFSSWLTHKTSISEMQDSIHAMVV